MSRRKWITLLAALTLVAPLMFFGCSGDDGADGAPGKDGKDGLDAVSPSAGVNPESCAVCHSDVAATHRITGVASLVVVGQPAVDNATGILTVNLRAAIDNTPSNVFTLRRAYVNYDNAAITVPAQYAGLPVLAKKVSRRFDNLTPDNVTFVNTGSGGNYTATIPPANVVDNGTYLFQLYDATWDAVKGTGNTSERPIAVFTRGTRTLRDLVTNTGCASCHGPYPAWSKNFSHYAAGGSDCQICHTQLSPSVRTMEARTLLDNNSIDNVTTAVGSNFPEYIHGIHNSHNMPGGSYYRSNPPPGFDAEDLGTEERYSVGYPSDMRNCNVCHETPAQQATIAAAQVSYFLCMSCHQNWDGFRHVHAAADNTYKAGDPIFSPTNSHRAYGPAQNCMSCHAGDPLINEASDFHNDFQATDAHYDSFHRGEDISFNNPDNVLFKIIGVQKSGDNVAFTWSATKNGVAVDPCNTVIGTGPTFRSLGAYLAYAKGDDWVNENVSAGQAPGQPANARNLFTQLSTTCASNVATTTGLVVAPGPKAYAKKALLAIGGKPLNQGSFTIGAASAPRSYFVRVPSPTLAFSMVDNSAVAARRNSVNSDKCNKCHRGTMYQHGGDRVDNEQMCVICHNPSASEKNVRAATYRILNSDNTVNTGATYDGKTAETYDLRYLLHAIHGAEKREKPIVIYRGRGIFAFAPPVYETIKRGTPTNPNATVRVSVDHPRPTGWPADETTAQRIAGSLNDNVQTHTWTTIHYPKPYNDCLACHDENFDAPADQTKAVALTVDPGTSYNLQNDDLVIGPTAAACTACHESTGPSGIPVQRHATYDFGYKAVVAKEVMLEKAAAVALSPDVGP